jgi:hypothetical protein
MKNNGTMNTAPMITRRSVTSRVSSEFVGIL